MYWVFFLSFENQGVYSALAQEESRSLGESISWGRKALAKQGVVKHSMRTYGYEINKDGTWDIIEKEAKVVRSIFKRYIAGTSANQISKDLTVEGIPTLTKKPAWNSKTVSVILGNVSYTGDLLYQKRYTKDTFTSRSQLNFGDVSKILVEDHHPAIIDRETWDSAQQILEKRKPNRKNRTKKAHDRTEFFSTFKCSECGSLHTHIVIRSKNFKKHKWRCKAAVKKDPLVDCDAWYIDEEVIMELFMKMLRDCKIDPHFESEIDERIESKRLTESDEFILATLEEEILRRYQELYKVVEEGGKIGEDTSEIKMHTDGIMAVQDQINEVIDKEDEYKFLLKEKKWLMKELDSLPGKGKLLYRSDIFERLVTDGTVAPDNSITFNLTFGISRHVKK